MHRSSNTIGSLAGALSKAQAELVNPEKSLTGSIRSPLAPNGERTFRYAPLSSGLEIVRKCLAKYEIAAIQSTTIDQDVGMVKLVTVLAHASGEWISSDWPVCPLNEIGSPQRMGAALTYSRRYSLFTLVGIAGEDDLDAPDLHARTSIGTVASANFSVDAREKRAAPRAGELLRGPSFATAKPILGPEQSTVVRDKLMTNLEMHQSSDELIAWARRALPVKNTLSSVDARIIDEAFVTKMAVVASAPLSTASEADQGSPLVDTEKPSHDGKMNDLPASVARGRKQDNQSGPSRAPHAKASVQPSSNRTSRDKGIDKSVLAIATPKRHRNKAHLRFVASKACLVCGREPSDPHHLRFAQTRGLGLKVSDEFTVPLCRTHHRDVHRSTNEPNWWTALNIEPLKIASALWQQSIATKPSTHGGQADNEARR